MEGKRGNDLQALTEIADNDVLIVDTGEGTRKITYGALCAAVKNTLGIREVVESTNITEPGFLMDGKTASEALAELYSKNGYSFEETCIGTWVDGKPLYRKVITQSADIFVPSSSYAKYKIAHNISNFSRANKCYICMQSGSTTYILPYFDPGNGAIGTYVHAINRENVIVCSKDNWGNYNIIIVIEYTKTTD